MLAFWIEFLLTKIMTAPDISNVMIKSFFCCFRIRLSRGSRIKEPFVTGIYENNIVPSGKIQFWNSGSPTNTRLFRS